MKAIVLAAGQGARLRPLTEERPKCLVEVDGAALIDYQLAVLKACGVGEIVVLGGYRSAMLAGRASRMHVNPEFATTNMLWTLFSAREEIAGDVLICYGDIVYAPSVLRALLKSDGDISVVVDRLWEPYWTARFGDPLADAETLVIGPQGTIVEIGQKPRGRSSIQAQYIGLIRLTARGCCVFHDTFDDAVSKGAVKGRAPQQAYMTDFLQLIADSSIPVHPVVVDGGWIEVDAPPDIELPATLARLKQVKSELEMCGGA